MQTLRHQIEDAKNTRQVSNNQSYLYEEKRKLDIKLIERRQELGALEGDIQVKKSIFNRNKEYN